MLALLARCKHGTEGMCLLGHDASLLADQKLGLMPMLEIVKVP